MRNCNVFVIVINTLSRQMDHEAGPNKAQALCAALLMEFREFMHNGRTLNP